ncbi:MAG: lysylphosphatidylglycerol synthase transmembrane domain-containing protein [Gammaproteobacteria bacterium]|nr:MAG: lysylphosphatidylglycerol synthase transmembrane domain-containing protein [Gammaproteobacteria bacterium]
MDKTKFKLLILLKVLIALVLIGSILSKVNLDDVWLAFSRANKWLIISAFFLYFVGLCIIASRWKLLLAVQGVTASFSTLVKSMIVAVFFNNFLPSTIGGDAMRAYDTWKMGGGKTQSVSIIFIDRLLGIFTLFMFALLALLLTSHNVSFIPDFKLWVLFAVFVGIVAIYILFFKAAVISRYLHTGNQESAGTLKRILLKVFDVFAVYNGKPGVLSIALILSVLLQLNVIFHYYLLALSLSIDIPLSAMFIIIPVAIVVMMIPVSINAIGVRELIFVALFGLYGVNSADALAFSWMSFILITLLGVMGGIVFMFRRKVTVDVGESKT